MVRMPFRVWNLEHPIWIAHVGNHIFRWEEQTVRSAQYHHKRLYLYLLLCPTQDQEGVFRTPFQSCPLDLATDAFYHGRKDRIEKLLKRIEDEEQVAIVQETWTHHCGRICEGVNWQRHSLNQLIEIMTCVGGPALAGICRLFAEDYKGWSGKSSDLSKIEKSSSPAMSCWFLNTFSSFKLHAHMSIYGNDLLVSSYVQSWFVHVSTGGFPDLLLWNPMEKRAKVSEVKGPRDKLSNQQRAWFAALDNVGLDSEVFKVVSKQ